MQVFIRVLAMFMAFSPLLATADVKLAGIMGDNMVLQREREIPAWGWASPGESVTVVFGGQSVETKASEDGTWMVKLSPIKASTEPREFIVRGANTIKLKNVLVGDVWLCSGQSNMDMSVGDTVAYSTEKVKGENYPLIRILKVPQVSSFSQRKDIEASLTGGWRPCSPGTVLGFSAVGYYYGRELFNAIGIPIGLIQAAWPATPALAWTSANSTAKYKNKIDWYEKCRQAREKEVGFQPGDSDRIQDWTKAQIELAKTDKEMLARLSKVQSAYGRTPSNLYNGMIAPLIPFGIRGVVWYQGEEDVWTAYAYRDMFRGLIRDWRKNWGQENFPFYFVQLANVNSELTLSYAELRESQTAVLDEPNTGMAVAIDIGEANDVHFKNKLDVGRRLSLIALAKTYGKDVPHEGPVFESMALSGNKLTLKFRNSEGGLVCKGGKLEGFSVTGENPEKIERAKGTGQMVKVQKFYPAEAQIQGSDIIIWNENVSKPFAVRYGWENAPECNLYNKAGLPARPFRTDDWPGIWAN